MRNFDETADLPYGIQGAINNHEQTPLTSNRYGLISRYVGNKNEGIVIFLDALGIKGIWERLSYDDVTKKWDKVTGEFGLMEQSRQHLPLDIRYRALSDTIIITISSQNNIALETILNITFNLLLPPFIESIKSRILLRGTVSYGEFYWSEKLIIGRAVDDAAYYHARIDWIGISICPNILKKIKINQIDNRYLILYNNIPYKDRYRKGLVLDWPKYDNGNCLKSLQQEEHEIENSDKDNSTKSQIKQKYNNTYNFYFYSKKSYQNKQ
jgi:hypothetical protein